ncbi:MAG: TSUP family transporter [Burkholderiaceae bacterium]|jgi:uncharacterized membrane protein YfcA
MTSLGLALIGLSVVFSSFLSGVFGMAGGMVLMGLLVLFLPVALTMVLHATAQIASNFWRAWLWRTHVRWRIVGRYGVGVVVATALFGSVGFIPDKALVLIALGLVPYLAVLIPAKHVPQADKRWGAELAGFLCTIMQFLAGVSGALLDAFFIRSQDDRRRIVATKAAAQTMAHFAKLLYFSWAMGGETPVDDIALVIAVLAAMTGTTLGKIVLDRMNDVQFRRWTQGIVLTVGTVYLVQGVYLLLSR